MAAAQPVDLQLVAAAHDMGQYPVTMGDVRRQVVRSDEGPARGAAAHEDARDFQHR